MADGRERRRLSSCRRRRPGVPSAVLVLGALCLHPRTGRAPHARSPSGHAVRLAERMHARCMGLLRAPTRT